MKSNIKSVSYFVSGMHCPSCELIVEKRLLEEKGIESVEVSLSDSSVTINYIGAKPTTQYLDKIFKDNGYSFHTEFVADSVTADVSCKVPEKKDTKVEDWIVAISLAASIVSLFYILGKFGFSSLINVSSTSSLPTFFLFGLIAGTSSCAALVGGLVLSMSKQWGELYGKEDKFTSHILFNVGRLISFAVLGALLGVIGNFLQLSLVAGSLLVIATSLLMAVIALQMLGVKSLQSIRIGLPKSVTRFAADEGNFTGKYMPLIIGALTFLLPCGFTVTVQTLAVNSGSAIQGALMLLSFALGTAPMLLAIGFSSSSLASNHRFSSIFGKLVGILLLMFAVYNVNAQMNVLGYANLKDIFSTKTDAIETAPLDDGVQVLEMTASSTEYSPNEFTIKAGVPVRWEIENVGVSGCTNAIVARGLFEGQIDIGEDGAVFEFTPEKSGTYKFSCWMGMVTGTIFVVDSNGEVESAVVQEALPANAGGCGGGCDGSCGVTCGSPTCSH